MPDPAPPPEAPRARVMPADLDRLVNEALRGKGVKALHEALRQANTAPAGAAGEDVASIFATDVTTQGVAPPGAVSEVGPFVSHVASPVASEVVASDTSAVTSGSGTPVAPLIADEAVTLTPRGDPTAQVIQALDEAEEALTRARERLTDGELLQAVEILRQLAARLPERLPELAEPAAAEAPAAEASAVPLPLFRFGWALVIDGLADAARAPALVTALGQDLATARLHAVSAAPKVVQRGEDEAALQARAERLRAEGIHTSVLHRSMVQRLGRPVLARSFVWGGPVWTLDGRAHWEGDPEEVRALRGAPWTWGAPLLGVLGEVTVVRSRSASAPGRFARKTLGVGPTVLDERRVGVLDLWGEDGLHLRLVEGLTDSGDSRAPFRAMVETITTAAPALRLVARRVCRPEESRAAGEPGEAIIRSGWPTFEEHTRLCWLHLRGR